MGQRGWRIPKVYRKIFQLKKEKKKQQANASLWQINEVLLLRKNMIYLSMNIKCF